MRGPVSTSRTDTWVVRGLGALSVAYCLFYWRYSNQFDLDHGRWLYEVWRFTLGERVYDFIPWQYPPAGLYTYGWFAALFSSTLFACFLLSAILFLAICWLGFAWFRRALPDWLLAPALTAAFFIGVSRVVRFGGAPLSTGSYVPSQPLGGVLLLLLLLGFHRFQKKPAPLSGFVMGMGLGALFLTKQDFWGPGLIILLAGLVPLESGSWKARLSYFGSSLAGAVAVFGGGMAEVYSEAGALGISLALRGFNQAGIRHLLPLPRSLLYQATWLCLFCGGLACLAGLVKTIPRRQSFRVGTPLLVAGVLLFLLMSWVGHPGSSGVAMMPDWSGAYFRHVAECMIRAFLPLSFTVVPLGWLVLNRKRLDSRGRWLVFFTLLAASMRLRRGLWAGYDWFFPFADLPMLFLTGTLLWEERARPLLRALFAVFAAAHLALTLSNHTFAGIRSIETARGTIRVKTRAAEAFEGIRARLKELDPGGERPVLAIPTQSLTYFLGRRNPTHWSQGITFSRRNRAEDIRNTVESRAILLASSGMMMYVYNHYEVEQNSPPHKVGTYYRDLFPHYRLADGEYRFGPWYIYVPASH